MGRGACEGQNKAQWTGWWEAGEDLGEVQAKGLGPCAAMAKQRGGSVRGVLRGHWTFKEAAWGSEAMDSGQGLS